MTFDRSAIMKRAWVIVRQADRSRFSLSFLLRNALRTAWREAKAARRMALARPVNSLSAAQRALASIENKDRLTNADWQAIASLRAQVNAERVAVPAAA